MENLPNEVEASLFCQCVREIVKKEKEAARQLREGYIRLGLEFPPQIDNTRTLSVAERLWLK